DHDNFSVQIRCPVFQSMNKLVYDKHWAPQRTRYGRQEAKGQGPAARQAQFFACFLPAAVADQVAGADQILSLKRLPKTLAAPVEELFVGPEGTLEHLDAAGGVIV